MRETRKENNGNETLLFNYKYQICCMYDFRISWRQNLTGMLNERVEFWIHFKTDKDLLDKSLNEVFLMWGDRIRGGERKQRMIYILKIFFPTNSHHSLLANWNLNHNVRSARPFGWDWKIEFSPYHALKLDSWVLLKSWWEFLKSEINYANILYHWIFKWKLF